MKILYLTKCTACLVLLNFLFCFCCEQSYLTLLAQKPRHWNFTATVYVSTNRPSGLFACRVRICVDPKDLVLSTGLLLHEYNRP